SEPSIPNYFSGDAEVIKNTPVLENGEWIALVEKVLATRTRTTEFEKALQYAAIQIRIRSQRCWGSPSTRWHASLRQRTICCACLPGWRRIAFRARSCWNLGPGSCPRRSARPSRTASNGTKRLGHWDGILC